MALSKAAKNRLQHEKQKSQQRAWAASTVEISKIRQRHVLPPALNSEKPEKER